MCLVGTLVLYVSGNLDVPCRDSSVICDWELRCAYRGLDVSHRHRALSLLLYACSVVSWDVTGWITPGTVPSINVPVRLLAARN